MLDPTRRDQVSVSWAHLSGPALIPLWVVGGWGALCPGPIKSLCSLDLNRSFYLQGLCFKEHIWHLGENK